MTNNVTEFLTVNSSMIKDAWYKPETKSLVLSYNSGASYSYKDVPRDVFESLRYAESKGSFIHTHIIAKFEFSKW
jgi:hypothetical protein